MPSEQFLSVFRQAAAETNGTLTFEQFMRLALYTPEIGYYQKHKTRIGKTPGTDFYTATTNPLFAELVLAAALELLAQNKADPGRHTFVEIAPETDATLIDKLPHPFAATRAIRLNDPIRLTGPLVVFSNELFDAQPVRRLLTNNKQWREIAVREHDGNLSEILTPNPVTAPYLPAAETHPDNYHLDAPEAAARLARQVAAQPWHGLFLAFDYGKNLEQLLHDTPQGTLRAYHRHTRHNELLANPTDQDLTAHICWNWLADALRENNFTDITFTPQETFFTRQAAVKIRRLLSENPSPLSPAKRNLAQLLHPAHMGQKFQALHAFRSPAPHNCDSTGSSANNPV